MPVLKTVSRLPVIVDPSHAAGVRCLVPVLARAAAVVGADGLLVEVHPSPDQAMSDGAQSLTFRGFRDMMDDLAAVFGDSGWRAASSVRNWLRWGERTSAGTAHHGGAALAPDRDYACGSRPSLRTFVTLGGIGFLRITFHGCETVRAAGLDSRRRTIQFRRNHFSSRREGRHSLMPDFAASADPAVSFDGKNVLFAGKQKAGDHWQIWEVALGGDRAASCGA